MKRSTATFSGSASFSAHTTRFNIERLGKKIASEVKGLETDAYLVPQAEQHSELGSDFYHGGIIYPNFASVDPARLHQGILNRVLEAEATVIDHCPAIGIDSDNGGFCVTTPRGSIQTRDVIVASNGYTGSLTPSLKRRIIPIGSSIIATEVLPTGLMDRLIPKDRVAGDTRRLVFYYRASPDRKSLLFGGRVSLAESDALVTGSRLFARMTEVFPELAQTPISILDWVCRLYL